MKGSLGTDETPSLVAFVQDDSGETLTAQLSNNDFSAKDDILVIDSKGRIVEYWDANKSGLYGDSNEVFTTVRAMAAGTYSNPCEGGSVDVDECAAGTHECDKNADCFNTEGSYACACKAGYFMDGKACKAYTCSIGPYTKCRTCKAQPWRNANDQCTSCNPGYQLKDGACVEMPKPESSSSSSSEDECDMRDGIKGRASGKGGKLRNGKTKSACECRDSCKKEVTADKQYMAYMFTKPKKNRKGKMGKKGKCACLTGKKGKARFAKKADDRFISGTLA